MPYLEDTSESHMPLFGRVIVYFLTCYREISNHSYCDGERLQQPDRHIDREAIKGTGLHTQHQTLCNVAFCDSKVAHVT